MAQNSLASSTLAEVSFWAKMLPMGDSAMTKGKESSCVETMVICGGIGLAMELE